VLNSEIVDVTRTRLGWKLTFLFLTICVSQY